MHKELRQEILYKQREGMQQALSHLAQQRAAVELRVSFERKGRPAGCLPYTCYDNRHSEEYLKLLEEHVAEFHEKNSLALWERAKMIDQALGYAHYRNFYPDLWDNNLTLPPPLKNHTSRVEDKILRLMKLGLRELKITSDYPKATRLLMDALKQTQRAPALSQSSKAILLPALYDYLAMATEPQLYIAAACKFLTLAIEGYEQRPADARITKYVRLRRAYLHLWLGNPGAALVDLNQALTWRGRSAGREDIFILDEIIYWEKAKVFIEQNQYACAITALHELINACQLNYKRRDVTPAALPKATLITEILNLIETLSQKPPIKPGVPLPGYAPRRSRPEARSNYDSFQVNAKCVEYQAFIAKIHAAPRKTDRDWQYLAVYEFSRYGNNRTYEAAIPIRAGGETIGPDNWWTPGVRLFYLERDYRAAAQFFTNYLTQTPDFLGYELAAKAQLALGDYSAALKYSTKGIALLKKSVARRATDFLEEAQFKIYHLLRAVAYINLGKPARAEAEFAAGLRRRRAQFERIDKIHSLLHWERARLRLTQKNYNGALHDLKKIEGNIAVQKYLKFLAERL